MIKGYLLTLLLAIVFLTSCDGNGDGYKIGVSQCSGFDWREQMNDEIKREAFMYDEISNVEIRTAYDDVQRQIADIRYFIDRKVDILLVSPLDPDLLVPVIAQAYDAGIPVILFDRKLQTHKYTTFIGGDNRAIAANAGHYAVQVLEGKGRILEIGGGRNSTPARERHEGFASALAGSQVQLVQTAYADWLDSKAQQVSERLLQEYPDVDLIFCHTDFMAQGVYKTLLKKGLEGRVKLLGIDGMLTQNGGLGMVLRGELMASFTYPTGGEEMVRTALQILHHEEVDSVIDLHSIRIDAANAEVLKQEARRIAALSNMIESRDGKIINYSQKSTLQRRAIAVAVVVSLVLLTLLIIIYRMLKMKTRLNSQLEQQRDKLIDMQHKVQDATNAKLMFFTNVSHDIRTPLSLIVDPVHQLVKDATMDEHQHATLLTIERNVHTLLTLINQLLDFRKMENGVIKVQQDAVDMESDLSDLIHQFSPAMTDKHVTCNVVMPQDKLGYVLCDRRLLQIIVLNLMSNAVKYTPDEGCITVTLSVMPPTDDNPEPRYSMQFSNTGSYIPEAEQSLIFDRFYQAENAQPGSGIGLALVKSCVEALHGTLSVTSDTTQGTTFTVALPLQYVTNQPVQQSVQLATCATPTVDVVEETSHLTVLVIDDNEDLRTYLTDVLETTYIVITAANGQEGLEKAMKFVPDVILCDVMMPVMDGMECCRRLKNNALTSHIPVVLLTARTLDGQRAEGYACGADSYLTKPFSSEVLLARISNLIAGRKQLSIAFKKDRLVIEDPDISDIEKTFVNRLYGVMHEHLSEVTFNVDELARHLGYSRVQLYRKVKMLTGLTPVEALRDCRLRKAHELIRDTDYKVVDISAMCGFAYPTYFSKIYKEKYGLTPSEAISRRG